MTTFTTEDRLTVQQQETKAFLKIMTPLTEEQIKELMSQFYSYNPRLLDFARAIERAHGIA
jgi:hypothetical protein